MTTATKAPFDTQKFLNSAGQGRHMLTLEADDVFFYQGVEADSLFYLQTGRAKLTVVSDNGREAILAMLIPGDFFGETAISSLIGPHLATAIAITTCNVLKIEKRTMRRVVQEEVEFSQLFMSFLIARGARTQSDLVDHLFNSSERRLARILLLMAEATDTGLDTRLIPYITQETLAEMIGTTRSRVSFFMNRFREQGCIDYNGRIHVHALRLKGILEQSKPGRGERRLRKR